MKKRILAVSAAAAIGGLGFAGAAHAVYYFGDSTEATFNGVVLGNLFGDTHTTHAANATGVMQNEGGIGNYLFTPYFSTQADNNTLLSIVNTDTTNGKIVKVRFRGAANSEDLLDFQVFLSPADVWTASLTQGADGKTVITTPDKSCTLPSIGTATTADRTFKTNRLVGVYPGSLGPVLTTDAQKNAQTREGYVEYLNMADVVPGSPLFTAIKHVNGVAPCTPGMMALLSNTAAGTDGSGNAAGNNVNALGMSAPSGGLTGTWSLFSNAQTKAYGDNHIAVEAVDDYGNPARGRISYAPQLPVGIADSGADAATLVSQGTADPVLVASPNSVMWNDLPDMSTPVPMGITNPTASVVALSQTLSKESLNNEFVATGGAGPIPWDTDWVVSHATRRYYATVTPTGGVATGDTTFYSTANGGNLVARVTAGGYMLCQAGTLVGWDREEGTAGVAFSPSSQTPFCGEVNTLSFNRASQALSASVTNQVVTLTVNGEPIQAGWARLALRKANSRAGASGAPVVGYSATSAINTTTNGNFGYNNRHRWTRAPRS